MYLLISTDGKVELFAQLSSFEDRRNIDDVIVLDDHEICLVNLAMHDGRESVIRAIGTLGQKFKEIGDREAEPEMLAPGLFDSLGVD